MANIVKKGGRNLTANILIIKQYVIIRVFPVHTGIKINLDFLISACYI